MLHPSFLILDKHRWHTSHSAKIFPSQSFPRDCRETVQWHKNPSFRVVGWWLVTRILFAYKRTTVNMPRESWWILAGFHVKDSAQLSAHVVKAYLAIFLWFKSSRASVHTKNIPGAGIHTSRLEGKNWIFRWFWCRYPRMHLEKHLWTSSKGWVSFLGGSASNLHF